MILYLQHIDIEGPETIGEFLDEKGFDAKIVRLNHGELPPTEINEIQAVIVLGGPMNVFEEDKYPWLKIENEFIQKILRSNIPYLGFCLGSQLLAKACGAAVVKSPEREIGFKDVQLSAAGQSDPLFDGVEPEFLAYHWHEDMVQLPDNASLLASSDDCPHQAFRVNSNAYGLQFHVEISDQSIVSWTQAYIADTMKRQADQTAMLDEYRQIQSKFDQTARTIYQNFLSFISQSTLSVDSL